MLSFDTYISRKLLLVGLISAVFIIYPNIACLPWDIKFLEGASCTGFYWYFVYRFFFFWGLICLLLRYNLRQLSTAQFKERFGRNFLYSLAAYAGFASISYWIHSYGIRTDFLGSTLISQFFILCSLCTLIGHISMLYSAQREKEREIERLRIENLQSQCDALANQINPHFFFNSLNGVQSLIRKKDDEKTLMYVHELSDIFRYILQSDKRGLVTLREELEFIQSFRYVMEVRFANKLVFSIQVDEVMQDELHKMEIIIRLNEQKELVVSNPIYPKLSPPDTNGTGLKNLENRFALLMNRQIRIECDENTFRVYLPLNKQN